MLNFEILGVKWRVIALCIVSLGRNKIIYHFCTECVCVQWL